VGKEKRVRAIHASQRPSRQVREPVPFPIGRSIGSRSWRRGCFAMAPRRTAYPD
jgi:hypothetical protein